MNKNLFGFSSRIASSNTRFSEKKLEVHQKKFLKNSQIFYKETFRRGQKNKETQEGILRETPKKISGKKMQEEFQEEFWENIRMNAVEILGSCFGFCGNSQYLKASEYCRNSRIKTRRNYRNS